jgi:hypothetical protein
MTNRLLETSLGAVNPGRVIVVDPRETASFEAKAPALFALRQRATQEFCVRTSAAAATSKLCEGEFAARNTIGCLPNSCGTRSLVYGRN